MYIILTVFDAGHVVCVFLQNRFDLVCSSEIVFSLVGAVSAFVSQQVKCNFLFQVTW